MSDEPDLLIEKLRAMASEPDSFSKQELGIMLRTAADRIDQDARMMERVRSEIQLAVKSIDNARARAVLAKTEAKGHA
jgi:hypothetical protein